jgi:hypothetical protein
MSDVETRSGWSIERGMSRDRARGRVLAGAARR